MPLKTLLKKIAYYILLSVRSGPLKGYRWIAGSGIKFIKGNYELETVDFLESNIKQGATCYDIGGHVGYISLIMGKLAGKSGKVFTFEPRPINISYIERHISMNHIGNVSLLKTGLSNYEGSAKFDLDTGTGMGKIANNGTLEIKVQSLDTLYEKGEIDGPNFIKMDIEGEEVKALKGAEKLLKKYMPVLNISTHGEDIHEKCMEFIKSLGYQKVQNFPGGIIAVNT